MKQPKRYKKRPIVIEAMQLTRDIAPRVALWCGGKLLPACEGIAFKTLESHGETQVADYGDFIIKGVAGEFYPCKPDIFHKTYEEVQ